MGFSFSRVSNKIAGKPGNWENALRTVDHICFKSKQMLTVEGVSGDKAVSPDDVLPSMVKREWIC